MTHQVESPVAAQLARIMLGELSCGLASGKDKAFAWLLDQRQRHCFWSSRRSSA